MESAFEVKSARLDVFAVQPNTADTAALETLLQQYTKKYPELGDSLFTLDMQNFTDPAAVKLSEIISLFARYGCRIVSLRHPDSRWNEPARQNGLSFTTQCGTAKPAAAQTQPAPETKQSAPAELQNARPAVLINTPVRTGQQVYAENADLIVTGMVSEGAELIADGNIHIYAPMRGRALAGAAGNRNARIFIHSMQAELVSVAGIYRNFEQNLPPHLHKQPVQIALQDDRLVISAISTE
ncbi:septum site-determining protein MinC [Neisseria weaveri]|uniref:septum site-determining protein MinC n=1 Tax=Neisseria weaveri TaxID=28091 RepID=UPI0002232937|nr:septum site-determining protein MinC [Neisseria weaveri]EGV37972.1 septum site-determining protein MinC [Neisseria weaveri ATCC 51223]